MLYRCFHRKDGPPDLSALLSFREFEIDDKTKSSNECWINRRFMIRGKDCESTISFHSLQQVVSFEVGEPVDLTQLALTAAEGARASGPPPVSLATVMGPDFATMFQNLGAALRDGALAPVLLVATR